MYTQLYQGGLLVREGPKQDKAAQPGDCGPMIGNTQLIINNDSRFSDSLGRRRRTVTLDVNVVILCLEKRSVLARLRWRWRSCIHVDLSKRQFEDLVSDSSR